MSARIWSAGRGGGRRSSSSKVSDRAPIGWESASHTELLATRFCDLKLRLEDSPLQERMIALQGEFEAAGLAFRPYAWFSNDWFTPDGTTGFAVPFYLAHRRLSALERRQMGEVEGGTRESCMQLLRHEAAHALDNAFRLRRRKDWREVFGPSSQPYRNYYKANPRSKNFVLHLDYFYAQSHPLEDFAETFAVWLRYPNAWEQRYADWAGALRKLKYVDGLMTDLGGMTPLTRTTTRPDSLRQNKQTLGEHYKRRASMGEEFTSMDEPLTNLFSKEPTARVRESAAAFLKRNQTAIVPRIADVGGMDPYVVEQVFRAAVQRCRRLDLWRTASAREVQLNATILLASFTGNFLARSSPWFWR